MVEVKEQALWLSVDDAGAKLDDADFRYVFEYWKRAAGDARAPRRRDIDPPIDLPTFLPTMVLFDVERDAAGDCTFRYRLMGTTLTEFAGRDFRGLTLEEAVGEEVVARDLKIYNRVVRDSVCYFGHRESLIHARKAFERYGRIVMPIRGGESGRIERVWSWLKFPGTPGLAP